MRHENDELRKGVEFIELNTAKMNRIACNELRNKGCADPEGHAEEVTSEVSSALMLKWQTLRSPMDAMYVYTVNEARTHARSCRRELAAEIQDHQIPVFSQPGREPDKMMEEMEFIDWALAHLKEEEAIVLKLRFVYDMSLDSIAELLQKSPGTVRSINFRSLKKLKEALGTTAVTDAVKRQTPAPES